MQNDAEYEALQHIIKADQRQRAAVYLLMLTIALVVGLLAYKANGRANDILSSQQKLVTTATRDFNTRTEENRRYTTCLLVIPPGERSVDVQRYCYEKSDLPGGRSNDEFVPIEVNLDDAAVVESLNGGEGHSDTGQTQSSSSPQSITPTTPQQPNNPQNSESNPDQPQPPVDEGIIPDNVPLIGKLL